MMNFRLIGAAALSFVLATPAMAMEHGYHHRYIRKESPVLHALKFGNGSSYGAYNFYTRDDFAPDNDSLDFDRRNTFN
jgi:hypothetical protein